MRGFIPDRSAMLKAAIRDGKAMRRAREARRRRPVRPATLEDVATIEVEEPEDGYQFPDKGHWS
jgi:hypothetical protein